MATNFDIIPNNRLQNKCYHSQNWCFCKHKNCVASRNTDFHEWYFFRFIVFTIKYGVKVLWICILLWDIKFRLYRNGFLWQEIGILSVSMECDTKR